MTDQILYDCRRGTQLSVFLDNRPGALAGICHLLGERQINIHALSVAEGLDHGYVRLVVDRVEEAEALFVKEEILSYRRDVLLLEAANQPASLAAVAAAWSEAEINIEYAYCAISPDAEKGLIVVNVDRVEKALKTIEPLVSR